MRFFGRPKWIKDIVPAVTDLWAPDIAKVGERYFLYYSASSFGENRSIIGLATNTTLDPHHPDYKWQDEGMVIASNEGDNWNAIDPNFILDATGKGLVGFW
ncbi:MAG: family 43 glycosylhydrolase [Deinococcales bacterium]